MIQCEGCYYQDKKDNVCCHENPFFDIDDNCTDYIENEFVKKIRADAIDEIETKLVDIILGNEEFTDWQKQEISLCLECVIEKFKENNK